MSRRLLRHPLVLAGGALALLLAAAPLLPDGSSPDDRGVRSGSSLDDLRAGAGVSAITPAAQAEIDRLSRRAAAGSVSGRVGSPASFRALAGDQVQCAEFEAQRYCLGFGWTDKTQAEVQAQVAVQAVRSGRAENRIQTGDLDTAAALRQTAELTPAARADAVRTELTHAAEAVGKVWVLRHEIQGVPYPDGFLARHAEIASFRSATQSDADAASADTVTPDEQKPGVKPVPALPLDQAAARGTNPLAAKPKDADDYPERGVILNDSRVAEQTRTYYCGPTSMQMIGWAWSGKQESQEAWASRLGTTTSGSAISELVRVTNAYTGYDQQNFAGPYVVLDIGDWTFKQWYLLMMRHIVDYRAPVILHPILLKRWYPYLDDDASGHFQVGRGYNKNGRRMNLINYFEPWNQQRFDPSEPYINRVQGRSAYKSYRANQEHFQHNLGV